MSGNVEPKLAKSTPAMPRFIVYACVLVVSFLLGFVPMWLKARTATSNLVQAEQRLTLSTMQNYIASAVIDARRGDYEPARQSASRFFTFLRAEFDKGDTSYFTKAQRESMQPLFAGRDEVITLLARSDPASADRLTDLYVAYRKIASG